MARSHDPVVRHAHHNLGPTIAFGMLAVATAIAIALAVKSSHKSSGVEQRLESAGPPCVDARPHVRGVQPSRGCGRIFDLIANYCAEHRVFCLRSQRRAVQRATAESTQHVIGQTASLPAVRGGGSSKGNSPKSPSAPSPDQGGGDNGGGNGGGEPDKPNSPPATGPPDDKGRPSVTVPDVPDVIRKTAPALCTIQTPLGPVVHLCP